MPVKYGSLPFDAQLAFFRKKLAVPTRGWTDLWQPEHDHAFVVAGATKMELLTDIQEAIQKAIEKGTTLAEFRKDFDNAVAKHGWSYNGSRSWRTRVIYHTNLRSSYNAGRFTQLQRFPYWIYHHSIASVNARPQHKAWDGLILPKEDSFWLTHYPQNGWGCNCSVTGASEARMKAKGWTVSQSPKLKMRKVLVGNNSPTPRTVEVPEGISPGFAYAPGRSAWMNPHILKPLDGSGYKPSKFIPSTAAGDLMPSPREFDSSLLLPKMQSGQEQDYVNAFLARFGADVDSPKLFTDAVGEAVIVSSDLFRYPDGTWKIGKHARSRELNMLAETIKDPDEIWVRMAWHGKDKKSYLERVYISRYTVNGEDYASIVVMNYNNGWYGTTAHSTLSSDELLQKISKNRKGVRLFKREL